MQKLVLFILVIGLVFVVGACNEPPDPHGPGGGEPGDAVEAVLYMDVGAEAVLDYSEKNPGFEIQLSDYFPADIDALADISEYFCVTVEAALYADEDYKTIAKKDFSDSGENQLQNLAWFKLLKESGGWDTAENILGGSEGQQNNMVVNGNTTWIVPNDATGQPGKLLVQANSDFDKVKSIKVTKVTFIPKSGKDLMLSWGSGVKTDEFKEGDSSRWPGKSLELSGATEGDYTADELLELSEYRRIIVDAVALDSQEKLFTLTGNVPFNYHNQYNAGSGKNDQGWPFFTLITDNSEWENSERVKRYNMGAKEVWENDKISELISLGLEGETDVTPATDQVQYGERAGQAWTDIPTHIVFQAANLQSGETLEQGEEVVSYVILRRIIFLGVIPTE